MYEIGIGIGFILSGLGVLAWGLSELLSVDFTGGLRKED